MDRVVKVERSALGWLVLVAPCGCRMQVDSPRVDDFRVEWEALVAHIMDRTPCPPKSSAV